MYWVSLFSDAELPTNIRWWLGECPALEQPLTMTLQAYTQWRLKFFAAYLDAVFLLVFLF